MLTPLGQAAEERHTQAQVPCDGAWRRPQSERLAALLAACLAACKEPIRRVEEPGADELAAVLEEMSGADTLETPGVSLRAVVIAASSAPEAHGAVVDADGLAEAHGSFEGAAKIAETFKYAEVLGGSALVEEPGAGELASGSRGARSRSRSRAGTREPRNLGSNSAMCAIPDGRLATGSWDNTAKIWSADGSVCLATLEGHRGCVSSVAFAADGRIATGSWDKIARIWSADGSVCLATLEGHRSCVSSVAFAADGRLATGSGDNTAKIWSADGSVCLATLEGHRN